MGSSLLLMPGSWGIRLGPFVVYLLAFTASLEESCRNKSGHCCLTTTCCEPRGLFLLRLVFPSCSVFLTYIMERWIPVPRKEWRSTRLQGTCSQQHKRTGASHCRVGTLWLLVWRKAVESIYGYLSL